MKLSKEVSTRIAMLRPILIFGVVFLHVKGISDTPSELYQTPFNWFAAFFKNGLFRGTVPTMSLIAGFLLFSSGLDRATAKLFKKKIMTLVIPYIIFNFLCFTFMATMNWIFGSVFPTLLILQQSPPALISKIFGLADFPINEPLHFVRDMIITVFFAPMLGYLIRNAPWLGLFGLTIFFGTNLDGNLIIRSSSLLLFYIGGVAASYNWNVLALDKYALPCLLALLAICIAIIVIPIDDNTILVMAAPILIWSSVSILRNTKIEAWALGLSKYSFFIFVSHMPLLATLWWATLTYAIWIPYAVFWLVAPVLVIAFLKVLYDATLKVFPTTFNFAIGSRTAKPTFSERRKAHRPVDAPVYSPEFRLTLTNS